MATFTPSFPPSSILRSKTGQREDEPRRQTKQEFRKQKELEKGRKAGTVPAMTDVETGKDINPHIPHYIANAPWYLNATGPTLKHQRPHPERQIELSRIYETYKRGVTNKVATKFRKGACENCGAMTHKKKDCFERPRKIGAKYSNEDIAPDEFVPDEMNMTYDAKRDRWSGFDPTDHSKVIEEYQRLEEARKVIKASELLEKGPRLGKRRRSTLDQDDDESIITDSTVEKLAKKDDGPENSAIPEEQEEPENNEDGPENEEDEDLEEDEAKDFEQDEDKYAEGADMPGVKLDVDSRTRITVRNLRIREDTAKYLYNLDPNSAYYDPKSRAMREDPFKNTEKRPVSCGFAGDNFKRYTGEVHDVDQGQLFAWEANQKGLDVHTLAEPTKFEELRKDYDVRKKTFKSTTEQQILEKYGGNEHFLDDETKTLILAAQTETYSEFNRKGELVKGVEKSTVKSRYEEDVYHNNHTAVWGSFWAAGQWGYKCCHSHVKNSYCIGDVGKSRDPSETALND